MLTFVNVIVFCSESQSEYTEYTGDNTDHFTEEATETEDCYTEATETEDNYGDGESSESEDESEYTDEDEDEEESEDEDGAVDDLLDEAMEDTIVTETETESEMETHRPVPQPRGSRDQVRMCSFNWLISMNRSQISQKKSIFRPIVCMHYTQNAYEA